MEISGPDLARRGSSQQVKYPMYDPPGMLIPHHDPNCQHNYSDSCSMCWN